VSSIGSSRVSPLDVNFWAPGIFKPTAATQSMVPFTFEEDDHGSGDDDYVRLCLLSFRLAVSVVFDFCKDGLERSPLDCCL
jgi:hypothetical protein